MKKILLGLCALFSVGTASAQSVYRQEASDSKLTDLSVNHMFKATVRQGDEAKVVVQCDERLKPYLIFELKGGKLTLNFETLPQELQNAGDWKHRVTADITVTELKKLSIANMASVSCEGMFTSPDKCRVDVSNMGSLQGLELESKDAVVLNLANMGKAADVNLKAGKLSVEVANMASLQGSVLESKDAVVLNLANMGKAADMNLKAGKLSMEVANMASIRNLNAESRTISVSASNKGLLAESVFQTGKLDVTASNSAKLQNVRVGDAEKISIQASSIAVVNLKGKTDFLQVDCSGTARADLSDLLAQRISAKTTSQGRINCYVAQELKGSTMKLGTIDYKIQSGKSAQIKIMHDR